MPHKAKGFTLIEMLIAVVVVGLIVGVLVGLISNWLKKATDTGSAEKIASNFIDMANAENLYYAKTGGWGTVAELVADGVLKVVPRPPRTVADQACLEKKGGTGSTKVAGCTGDACL